MTASAGWCSTLSSLDRIEHQDHYVKVSVLVQWFRNTSCTEGADAPIWPGATKEQIGNL